MELWRKQRRKLQQLMEQCIHNARTEQELQEAIKTEDGVTDRRLYGLLSGAAGQRGRFGVWDCPVRCSQRYSAM